MAEHVCTFFLFYFFYANHPLQGFRSHCSVRGYYSLLVATAGAESTTRTGRQHTHAHTHTHTQTPTQPFITSKHDMKSLLVHVSACLCVSVHVFSYLCEHECVHAHEPLLAPVRVHTCVWCVCGVCGVCVVCVCALVCVVCVVCVCGVCGVCVRCDVYMHAHMHTHTHTHIHMHMHMHTQTYTHTHTCTHTYTWTHKHKQIHTNIVNV